MRKVALTFCPLFVVFAVAPALFADDGPEKYSGKEMKQVAPAPPPGCFDWSGGYVGGFGGYKFSVVNQDLTLTGRWLDFPDARPFIENRSGNLNNDGGEVGGLIGYNWQFNCWVVGFEASGAYLWARDSSDTGLFTASDVNGAVGPLNIQSAFKTHYLFTLAPRFGYALGRFLPYVTGGLAVGDLDYEQKIRFPDLDTAEGGQRRLTNAGWFVGGGLQYALTEHWSVRAQYEYIDLGSINFPSDFQDNIAFRGAPANHEVSLREHNASFAIIYKF